MLRRVACSPFPEIGGGKNQIRFLTGDSADTDELGICTHIGTTSTPAGVPPRGADDVIVNNLRHFCHTSRSRYINISRKC